MVMTINNIKKIFLITIFPLVCLSINCRLSGQGTSYNYFYRVYFKDKGNVSPNDYSADAFLSQRAIKRRHNAGITAPVISDLPVNPGYLKQVSLKGFTLHCTSKWMNTGLFKTQNQADINVLLNLPFVENVKMVKDPAGKSNYFNQEVRNL